MVERGADEPEVTPEATPEAKPADHVVTDRIEAAERRIAEQAAEIAREREARERIERERASDVLNDKEKRLAKIKEYAASGQDALAPDYLELRDEVQRLRAEREQEKEEAKREKELIDGFNAELAKIKDPEERKAVRDHFQREYPKRPGLDIAAARAEVENETLRKALEAAKVKPREGIQTHQRDVTVSSTKAKEVARADFKREQQELPDEDRIRAQIALRSGIRSGTIRYKKD